MFQLVQMTAAYSNAVLVAILPHFTHVAKTLELPIPTPIVQSQIHRYFCEPIVGRVGGYVALTNGYEFWFHNGHVDVFSSPRNYFRVQDPDFVPKLYGSLRMNEKEAVALARRSLKELGYTNEIFDTVQPQVQLATSSEWSAIKQGVPQYAITWHDPDLPKGYFDRLVVVYVNAEVKHVDGFVLTNKRFWKPNPDVGVMPKPLPKSKPKPQYVGGRRMTPVTPAYSNACMNAVYPLFSSFAAKLNLPIHLPITSEQCASIDCYTDKGQPSVQIFLTNGDRFLFVHGYVMLYYAHDNYFDGGLSHVPQGEEYNILHQSQPVSTNELIQVVRQAIRKLGYSEKTLHMEGPPDMVTIPPDKTKTNFFTRYEIGWNLMQYASGIEGFQVDAEVDAKTKTIKFIQLNNTNLWREPPKIDVPPEEKTK